MNSFRTARSTSLFGNLCTAQLLRRNMTSHQLKKSSATTGPPKGSHPITTVLFDLDNTLIPTRKADAKACKRMTDILQRDYAFPAALAVDTTAHFLRTFRQCPDNEPIPLDVWRHRLWSEALPATHRHLAAELYAQWLELRFRYLALTTESVALLQSLHGFGYRLALITNGPSAAQWEKVRRLDVARYFECVFVSGDMPWEKPDARIFSAACRYLNVSASECVMVGDKLESDIQGALEARLGGSFWIPLSASELSAPRSVEPSYIIESVTELLSFLPPLSASGGGGGGYRGSYGVNKAGRRGPSLHRRVASLPDLDSGNSNSSDGS